MSRETVFEVRDGCFRYDRRAGAPWLLEDIGFQVRPGEITAVLGPNGSGKTTLLRCMMGFLPWGRGGSYLEGEDIRQVRNSELWRKIAYVPQARGLHSSYTVEEMALLGRASHFGLFSQPGPEDKRIAAETLAELGISHLAARPCAEISGGELQMVLIARALAARPLMLVLDEPESNLDFRNQLIILDTLRRLAAQGMACVFNTHYPSHALQHADNALLLDKAGRHTFGPAFAVISEDNLAAAFGVETVIGEIETRHKIYRGVMPLCVVEEDQEQPGAMPNQEIKEDTLVEDTRIAIIGIIVEDRSSAERINELLHEYGQYIISRMGMPYEKKDLSIICVVVDAPDQTISALSGKLGMLPGLSVKTTFSKR